MNDNDKNYSNNESDLNVDKVNQGLKGTGLKGTGLKGTGLKGTLCCEFGYVVS